MGVNKIKTEDDLYTYIIAAQKVRDTAMFKLHPTPLNMPESGQCKATRAIRLATIRLQIKQHTRTYLLQPIVLAKASRNSAAVMTMAVAESRRTTRHSLRRQRRLQHTRPPLLLDVRRDDATTATSHNSPTSQFSESVLDAVISRVGDGSSSWLEFCQTRP